MITSSGFTRTSLHRSYLAFAIRAARQRAARRRYGEPVGRHIVEAIRYSFDFIDASAEYAYHLLGDGPRFDTWLGRYVARTWKTVGLSDRLGLLSYTRTQRGFWQDDNELRLFEDLRHVRNALTHPSMFEKRTEAEYPDFHSEPVRSHTVVSGKMARSKPLARFAQHPEDLSQDDARKAVEIALRHAERFEYLVGCKNEHLFGVVNWRTGRIESATRVLARLRTRHFDSLWTSTPTPPLPRP